MKTRISADARAPIWVHKLAEDVNQAFERLFSGPTPLKEYEAADLVAGSPDATRLRMHVVGVRGTSKPAYSDGAVWRYFDGSAV